MKYINSYKNIYIIPYFSNWIRKNIESGNYKYYYCEFKTKKDLENYEMFHCQLFNDYTYYVDSLSFTIHRSSKSTSYDKIQLGVTNKDVWKINEIGFGRATGNDKVITISDSDSCSTTTGNGDCKFLTDTYFSNIPELPLLDILDENFNSLLSSTTVATSSPAEEGGATDLTKTNLLITGVLAAILLVFISDFMRRIFYRR